MSAKAPKALAVMMAKEPVAGRVKTRLSPPLTLEEAAELYRCFLQDRLLELGTLTAADVAVAYAPSRARKCFADLCPQRFRLFAQRGRTLGEKLFHIFRKTLSEGHPAVTIMGSDSPDLPNRIVLASLSAMMAQGADLVLGPSLDGGYYLIGAKKAYPELFAEIPWSTPEVLDATLAKAARLGLETELVSPWNDLDTYQDLVAYRQDFLSRQANTTVAGKITFSYLLNWLK